MAWSKLWRRANTARLATHLLALWKLFRHPDTPRPAKLVALLVLAYALSPIDLIPDFIPVLGWIDDLILLPLGIALAVRMTPRHLWLERVAEAEQGSENLPRLMWGAIIVIALWLSVLLLVAWGLVTLVTSGS
ncbi:MAG TPA: YkvA family protein [Burkholderiaceae bacterium]|nr:YkvA family protein [Burkholderiaceae bacterium]